MEALQHMENLTQGDVFGCGFFFFYGVYVCKCLLYQLFSDWEWSSPHHTAPAAALVGFWLRVMTLCHALAQDIISRGPITPKDN